MRIGTTSFACRYLLARRHPPRLSRWLAALFSHRLDLIQICENARPLEVPAADWREAIALARAEGVQLGLGVNTVSLDVFERNLALAETLDYPILRLVFEDHELPNPDAHPIEAFLETAVGRCESAGLKLALENHFHVSCAALARAAEPYPYPALGFCVDAANSLRNFEPAETVQDLLLPRALCHHVKDYRVRGHMIGFAVEGAPIGQGDLNLHRFLTRIRAHNPDPDLFVENWTPSSDDAAEDEARDAEWFALSLGALRQAWSQL